MTNALTDDQIAQCLRNAAEELLNAAINLTSRFQIQGADAEREYDSLERVVAALEPCRVPPAGAIVGGRMQPPQPLELTDDLFQNIGLRRGDVSLAIGRLLLIEATPQKTPPLSRGAESIIKQIEQQGAESDLVQKMRIWFAKLAVIRDYL
ncbi:MAG: hypothetical protein WA005_15770 [Candidatus Binataceae bacterium]